MSPEIQHHFGNDISKHNGELTTLISAIQSHEARFEPRQETWFARADQKPLLPASQQHQIVDAFGTERIDCILNWIREIPVNGAPICVHLISYDRQLLTAADGLTIPTKLVMPAHVFGIVGIPSTGNGASMSTSTFAQYGATSNGLGTPETLSLTEAVQLAKQVLIRGGHLSERKALHQNKLRPLMAELDPRAIKNTAVPSSVSLISQVVAVGLNDGWLARTLMGGQTGYEFIWLINRPNRSGVSYPVAPGSIRPGTILSGQSSSAVTPNSIPEVVSTAAAPTGSKPEVAPANGLERVAATPSTKPVESNGPRLERKPTKSDEYRKILEGKRLGCAVWTRERFYSALEDAMRETENPSVSELMARATEIARGKAQEQQCSREKNWEAASEGFVQLALASGLLLKSETEPIPSAIGSRSARVSRLVSGLRDVADGYLLEQIIKSTPDSGVNISDTLSLGLALFKRGPENPMPRHEILGRVDFLLGALLFSGRIEQIDGGILRYRKAEKANEAPA